MLMDKLLAVTNQLLDLGKRNRLLNYKDHGLKTLARGDEDFTAEYEGGLLQRHPVLFTRHPSGFACQRSTGRGSRPHQDFH